MAGIDPKHISTLIATDAELAFKVDKVAGKGLSTEDYTTTEKSKLGGIEIGATANATDAALRARSSHTGTQTASTISDFSASTLAVLLAGLSTATSSSALVGDTILQGIGKLQAQINSLQSSKYDASNPNSYETTTQLNARDVSNKARANHTGTQLAATVSDFASTVLGTTLTGFNVGIGTGSGTLTASDSVVNAFSRMQALFNSHAGLGGTTHPVATQSVAGFMSAADKTKSDKNVEYFYIMTSAQTTSGTTHTNVSALHSDTLPVGNYRFEVFGEFRSDQTTNGVGYRLVNGSATIGNLFCRWNIEQGAAGTSNVYGYTQTTTTVNLTTTSVVAANTDYVMRGDGFFTITAPGTVDIQFRSETGGRVHTLQPGTHMVIKQLIS